MARRTPQTAIETTNTSQSRSPRFPDNLPSLSSESSRSPENPMPANDQDGDFEKVEMCDSAIETSHSENHITSSAVPREGKLPQVAGSYKSPFVEQTTVEKSTRPQSPERPPRVAGNYKPPSVGQTTVEKSTWPQSSEKPLGSFGFGSDNREYLPSPDNQTQTSYLHRGSNANGDNGEHRRFQAMETLKSWGEKAAKHLQNIPPPPDVLIAIMGKTGTGKTSFINAAAGGSLVVGHGLQGCTQKIQTAKTEIDGRKVIFIDTPGFDDTNRSDVDILGEITAYLQASSSNDIKLSGIIYLHKITDTRVEGSTMKNMRMFRKLCGEGNFHNVILCTTGWDLVELELGEKREQELEQTENFWGTMMKKGARTKRHNYTNQTSAREIARELIEKDPVVLQIQEELMKSPQLTETSAGKLILEEMEKLKIDHEKEMKALKEDIEEARRSNSQDEIEQMRKEYEREIEGLRKTQVELEKLRRADQNALQKRIDELQNEINNNKGGGCMIC